MSERYFSYENNMDVSEKQIDDVKSAEAVQSNESPNDQLSEGTDNNNLQHSNVNDSDRVTTAMDEVPPNNEKDSQPIIIKKNVGWIVSFWIVLVCAGIALAVLGVKLADTQASYYKLQKDHSILQSAKSYVDSQNNKLSAEIASLKSENSKLQKQINGMSTGLYDAIYSFNSGKYYSDFHASTDIMVVKVGQKKTLDIYLNHYETTCDWEWTNGLICESECGEWNDNMTFPVYIIAKNAGTTVFTFKNSYNKETFNVLVVVVE